MPTYINLPPQELNGFHWVEFNYAKGFTEGHYKNSHVKFVTTFATLQKKMLGRISCGVSRYPVWEKKKKKLYLKNFVYNTVLVKTFFSAFKT